MESGSEADKHRPCQSPNGKTSLH